jgi:tetratricopeptide (TPR) repeat protein
MATSLHNLAGVAWAQGNLHRAAALNEEALGLWQAAPGYWGTATALADLGRVARAQGNSLKASGLYAQALELFRDAGDRAGMTACLEGLAGLVCEDGRIEQGARLFGTAAALRAAIGAPRAPAEAAAYERDVAGARRAAGEEAYTRAWEAGYALPLDQAVAAALASVA